MFQDKKILGIIPARGRSARLIGKNIISLNGKPLIAWSIEAAKGSVTVDKVVVSTEDSKIAGVALDSGADEVIKRSERLATDEATTTDALIEVLAELNRRREEFAYFVLLQPTSPLRTSAHIDEAFRLMKESRSAGVVSVCETEHPSEWMGKLPTDLSMDAFFEETSLEKRSQEFPQSYQINGAIYIAPIDRFLEERTLFLKTGITAYVMDRASSVDIDDEYDLQVASWTLNGRI